MPYRQRLFALSPVRNSMKTNDHTSKEKNVDKDTTH